MYVISRKPNKGINLITIKPIDENLTVQADDVFFTDVENNALEAMIDLAVINGYGFMASKSLDVFSIDYAEDAEECPDEPATQPDVSNNAINIAVRSVIMNTLTSDTVSLDSANTLCVLTQVLQEIETVRDPEATE